jgi:hypothetical protein
MDVAEWLRNLGLEQYEPAFRENKIGADLLPSLTAEDLKDLGVILVDAARPMAPCGDGGSEQRVDRRQACHGARVAAGGQGVVN